MKNEPVAWWDGNPKNAIGISKTKDCNDWIPLYTHPAELTDKEIISTMVQFDVYSSDDHCLIEAGRAILRKASEK